MYDYPVASTLFVQVDGINFLCNVDAMIFSHT